MTTLVDLSTSADLTDTRGIPRSVPVRLVYEDTDQLVVRLTVGDNVWQLSRDLIALGLTREVGEGNLRVTPGHKVRFGQPPIQTVTITLGQFTVRLTTGDLETFLENTYKAVPLLTEKIDVDAALERIFTEAGQ